MILVGLTGNLTRVSSRHYGFDLKRVLMMICVCSALASCSDDQTAPADIVEPEVDLGEPRDVGGDSDAGEVSQACDDSESRAYELVQSEFFTLALDPDFSWTELLVDASDEARQSVVSFEEPTLGVAGFLVSDTTTEDSPGPALDAIELDAFGVSLGENRNPEFSTHEGALAQTRSDLLEVTPARSLHDFRDELLKETAGFDVNLEPADADIGSQHDAYRIFATVAVAEGKRLTLVVVAPASRFDSDERVQRSMSDLWSSTAFAFDGTSAETHCQSAFASDGQRRVDWLWLVDVSTSMQERIAEVRAQIPSLFETLESSVDPRMTVVEMNPATEDDLQQISWHNDATSVQNQLDGLASSQGYGLQAGQQALEYVQSDRATESSKSRCSATVVTAFVSDRAPRSLVEISSDPLDAARQKALEDYETFYGGRTIAFAWVPLLAECLAPGVEPDRSTLGEEYSDIALSTGGSANSLCTLEDDPGQAYTYILTGSQDSDPFRLVASPIPQSIRVFKNDAPLERSRTDGFDYFPGTNSISLYGAARPVAAVPCEGIEPDHYAIHFDAF